MSYTLENVNLLLQAFSQCNTPLKDRFLSIPNVCHIISKFYLTDYVENHEFTTSTVQLVQMKSPQGFISFLSLLFKDAWMAISSKHPYR
jgi:hypothetical protein